MSDSYRDYGRRPDFSAELAALRDHNDYLIKQLVRRVMLTMPPPMFLVAKEEPMSSNGLAAVGSTKPITNEAERVLTERRDRLKAQLDGDRCQQKLAEDNAAMHKKNGDENEKKYKEVCRALGKITK